MKYYFKYKQRYIVYRYMFKSLNQNQIILLILTIKLAGVQKYIYKGLESLSQT